MPTELEAKFKVAAHGPTREKLRAAGAVFIEHHFETNTFFDTQTESLVQADRGLRLRIDRNPDTNAELAIITMKGPRQPGPFKSREELETIVSNSEATLAIFKQLGLHPTLSFQKRRESWELDDCKIELDELPHLGLFVEIEGPSEAAIESVRGKLELTNTPTVTKGYVTMFGQWLKAQCRTDTTIVFQ